MKRPYISGRGAQGLQLGSRVVINGTSWKAIRVDSIDPPMVTIRRWRWYDTVLAFRLSQAFWTGFFDGLTWGPLWRGIARLYRTLIQPKGKA